MYRRRERAEDFFREVTPGKHEENPWFEGASSNLRVVRGGEKVQIVTVCRIERCTRQNFRCLWLSDLLAVK
jgi:hypothetical protein